MYYISTYDMLCCTSFVYHRYAVCYYLRIHLDVKDNINVLASYFSKVLTIRF